MKRALSLKEIILYGAILGALMITVVFFITIEEDVHYDTYINEYTSDYIEEENLVIGILSHDDQEDVNDLYDNLATYLSNSIPNHSFSIEAIQYDFMMESMDQQVYDFMIVDPATTIALSYQYSANPLLTIAREIDGQGYASIGSTIITKNDSSISNLSDLSGKEVAVINQDSFEGYITLIKELRDNEISTSSVNFTSMGNYEAVVSSVLDGSLDAGVIPAGLIEEMITAGSIQEDDFKVVNDLPFQLPVSVSTSLYPEWSFMKAAHISNELANQVTLSLMSLDETNQELQDAGLYSFVNALNYHDVATALQTLKVVPFVNYGQESLQNVIYDNKMFLIIITSILFLLAIVVFFLLNTYNQMQRFLDKSQEMEHIATQANQARGEFLANMSHEIRTPMSAIIGLSTLLDGTSLSPRQKEYNMKLRSSAVNLLGIIENILDYSKIDAQKMMVEEIEFDLNDVLFNLSNVVSLKALEKNIELFFKMDTTLPRKYVGDPLRLGQALINIVTNAIKFTNIGQVVLEVDRVYINMEHHLEFKISDSGIGMTEEEIEKIVQPFAQADSSFTRKYGGTGLGLSITNQLITLMGGTLSIESVIGQGSTFSFTIPLPVVLGEETSLELPENLRDISVLVIDDNSISQRIMCDMIQSLGLEAKSVTTGTEAISELEKKDYNPDLIVIDYHLSNMSGVTLTQSLKEKRLLQSCKVLLMVSVFVKEDIIHKAAQVGVDEFIDKPVNPLLFYNTLINLWNENTTINDILETKKNTVDLVAPGTHIVLAEDNKINQQIVYELLTKEGFEVTIANDGTEVLSILEEDEFQYQLVLMDIQMPNMDGREATKAIRNKEWKYKHIPIIAMTAHALQLEREKSFEAGMDDFLTKPLEIDALFAVLSNYIEIVTVDLDEQKRSIEDCKLPFLDTEIGLMNVGNDHAFYIEILYNFLTDYRDYHETLVNLFKNGEIDDIIVETHTLRGLAATIGATKLDELTQKAETELQAKKYDYDSFMLFVNELRSIVKQLEQYFKENPFRERSIDVQK